MKDYDLEGTAQHYNSTIISGWESLYSTMSKSLLERLSLFFYGDSVLEMGCGDGEITQFLVNHFSDINVVDGSEIMLSKCKSRLADINIKYDLSYFEEFKPERKFDTILMTHILEHVEEPVQLLKKAAKWLSDRGRILLAVPNAGSIHRRVAVKMGILQVPHELNPQDILLGHKRVYYKESLIDDCLSAGLTVHKFGGVMLKPLTNRDIESNWSSEMVEGFIQLGDDFPELCAEIYAVLVKGS